MHESDIIQVISNRCSRGNIMNLKKTHLILHLLTILKHIKHIQKSSLFCLTGYYEINFQRLNINDWKFVFIGFWFVI